jgi:hypothetical protein
MATLFVAFAGNDGNHRNNGILPDSAVVKIIKIKHPIVNKLNVLRDHFARMIVDICPQNGQAKQQNAVRFHVTGPTHDALLWPKESRLRASLALIAQNPVHI